MKKTKLTRSLLAACSIVALTAVMYGCVHNGDGDNGTQTGTEMPDPTPQERIAALQTQINELRAELGLPAIDIDDLTGSVADLTQQVADLQKQVDDAAEDARKEKEDADRKAAEAVAAAMAATAAKLYAGIDAQMGDGDLTSAGSGGDRDASYNSAFDAILVSIDDNAIVTLSEDKDTMVAANAGWEGKRYTRTTPAADGMYEAIVYSNVEAPTMGDKFGSNTAGADGYEYDLTSGALAVNTSTTAAYTALVGGASFDHNAGVKRFPLPAPNPNMQTVVTIAGSFHGVSGTYSCTPGATVCAANVTGDGFQLGTVASATDATFTDGGGSWMFTPSNAEARVRDAADTSYASYGWWIHKAANDGDFTASAFVDERGTVAAASGLDDLNGTATYMGGAAGKYALASSTGGTNDAGHFTARATLEADFTNNTDAMAITGTIDQFMGADGMSRDWSVKLNGSAIADTGGIGENSDTIADNGPSTVWTIGETAAAAAGGWTGALRNNGTDGVPQVATGTFYSTYGTAGKMVGAFGANKE